MGLLEDVCVVGITGNGQQHRSEYILQKKKKELHTFTNVLKFHHRLLDIIERSEMLLSPNKSRNPAEK